MLTDADDFVLLIVASLTKRLLIQVLHMRCDGYEESVGSTLCT